MNRSGSASGYAGLDAAYHNYGMDMESWKSEKYSQARFKVCLVRLAFHVVYTIIYFFREEARAAVEVALFPEGV